MEHLSESVLKKKKPGSAAQEPVLRDRSARNSNHSEPVRNKARKVTCTIRRADPDSSEDRAAIERLWLDNLPGISADTLAGRFDWLYRHNPAGQTLTWLAVDSREGTIAGCASVLPREVVVNGKIYRGGIAIDFAIDKEYRSYGLALQMQRAISTQVWEQGIELVFGFPNAASRGVFQRIGYRNAGKSWRGAQLLRSASKLAQRGYSRPVAQIAGFGIDLALQMRNSLALLFKPGAKRAVVLDAPDERWETFWSRLSPRLSFAGSRDPDYVRWRYQLCPGLQGRYFCLLDEACNLLGYLVFSSQGGVLTINDVQVLEEQLLKPLLDRFWKEMRNSKAEVINVSLVGSRAMIDSFAGAGLVTRDSDGWAGVLVSPGMEFDLYDLLQREEVKWYLVDDEVDL